MEKKRWRVQVSEFRARAAARGLYSSAAIARAVGVSPTWLFMVLKDGRVLGHEAASRFARALECEIPAVFDEVRP